MCSINLTCYHTAALDSSHSNSEVEKRQSVAHTEEKLCLLLATNWEGGLLMAFVFGGQVIETLL